MEKENKMDFRAETVAEEYAAILGLNLEDKEK